jgi:hypothetical protein
LPFEDFGFAFIMVVKVTYNVYFARNFASTAPATRFPAADEPYFFPADAAILEKFLPFLPKSLPAAPAFAEYPFMVILLLLD